MRRTSKLSWIRKPSLSVVAALLLAVVLLPAAGRQVLFVKAPAPVTVKRDATAEVKIRAELLPGYHTNSDQPSDEYLIPLRLTWAAGSVEVGEVKYPEPELESYAFSDQPLSVYTHDFDIVTLVKVPAAAPTGILTLNGKLRYQACSDKLCLPPKTIPVTADLIIE